MLGWQENLFVKQFRGGNSNQSSSMGFNGKERGEGAGSDGKGCRMGKYLKSLRNSYQFGGNMSHME